VKLNNNATARRQHPRHGATIPRHDLVQRQHRTRRPGQARPQVGEVEVYIPPNRHVADRRRHHCGLRRQGQDLDVVARRRPLFDPENEKFTEFKSVTAKTAERNGVTYVRGGAATATAGGPR